MFQQIGQKPPSNFVDPIGMMEDCHQRIRFFLATLAKAAEISQHGALEPEKADGLSKALTYFREAAPKHTADEEESLFPRLRRSRDPHVHAVAGTLDVLTRDHACANEAHIELDALGRLWLEQGDLGKEKAARWRELVENLSTHYERHIALEEDQVFSAARQLLSAVEKQEIGKEMALRRGRFVT